MLPQALPGRTYSQCMPCMGKMGRECKLTLQALRGACQQSNACGVWASVRGSEGSCAACRRCQGARATR
jgi:hypothetical protein